jgi:hypothetical protein
MQPLKPGEAATLFFAGEGLAYLATPTTPFALGRYFGEPVLVSPLPFFPPQQEEARIYFKANPVIIAGTYKPPAPGVAVRALIKVKGAGWSVEGNDMAVALQLGQSVGLTISFLDAGGQPASKPGAVTWSSSDATTVSVTPNPTDDTQATAVSVAEGKTATITATSGGLSATIDISVGAGAAVSATITAGTPFSTPTAGQTAQVAR